MKQLAALQQQGRRSNSFRNATSPLDAAVDGGSVKSPATIFWLVIHGVCCLISLVLGFRFSRLLFFLLFSGNYSPSATIYSALQTPLSFSAPVERNMSRVVVGRHGILIRPWPHPDPLEVMKAHRIIERVQMEQRTQYGVKSPRTVIAITPTYVRTFQTLHLTGVMHSLMNVMNVPYDVVWIVVEAGGKTNETESLISKSGLKTVHVGFDGKMPIVWEDRHKLESKMRLHGLRVVREQKLDGIVMFADDSNMHSLELFDEIQNVRWIGAVSVGIIAHSGGSDGGELRMVEKEDSEKDGNEQVPVQGPACNASNHLVGWHTFDTKPFVERSARYIGDRGIVLPRKLEWAGFVLNSRLIWADMVERPGWVSDLDEVERTGEDVNSPLSLLKDTSVVEPLGSCGRKVMLWWLRVEARADSKFPARWIIDPPLEITVPAKRTPWPDATPEFPSPAKEMTTNQEVPEKRSTTKSGRRKRSSRGKKKRTPKTLDEQVSLSTTKTF